MDDTTGTPDLDPLNDGDVASSSASPTQGPPAAFTALGKPRPAPVPTPGVQLGLGPLMGLGTTRPQGRYAGLSLRDGALDSLQNTCLGGGAKVPEEVSAVKAALDAAVGVREDQLSEALCPPDVVELLRVQAFRALDAGVPLPLASTLWPALAEPGQAVPIARVMAWRETRISLRLFSRFEAIQDAPGLAAFKAWQEHARDAAQTAARSRANVSGELLLRDTIVDDPNGLAVVMASVQRVRAERRLTVVGSDPSTPVTTPAQQSTPTLNQAGTGTGTGR